MIVSQNAFTLRECELDAHESGTFKESKAFALCGSSMCRSKVSLSKVDIDGDFSNEVAEKNVKMAEYKQFQKEEREVSEHFGTNDVPSNGLFDREKPLTPVGIGAGSRVMSKRTKTKIRQKMIAWSRTPRKTEYKFAFITLGLVGDQVNENGFIEVGQYVDRNGQKLSATIVDQNGVECPRPCYDYLFPPYIIDQHGHPCPAPDDCVINHQATKWHTAQFNRMLNKYFTWCRKYLGFKNYLFVLEIQTRSTGRLHAHVICDVPFLPYTRMNAEWVKIQYDEGIRHKGEKRKAGKGGVNPFDCDKIFNIDRVPHYVTKYITKNMSEIDGTRWNCSNGVSRLFTSAKVFTNEAFASLWEHTLRVVQAKLDNGETLHIHLLSKYTQYQARMFKINDRVITGEFDKEAYKKFVKAI